MSEHLTSEMLQLAVQGELPPDRESVLYEHVETCADCAAAMERLAGVQQIESEAQASLRPDEISDFVPCRDFEYSAADFVVEHLEPSESQESLGRLGGYEVLEIIGRGGMGVVLKGYDRELKRFVAIKALAPHLAHNALARKRFSREAQAAAAVVNPHVIAIHQVQPSGKLPFLVMPLLTGESLAQRLKSRGLLDLKEVLRIGMQAAEGLAAAHEQGLVHRDVKPANILLEKGVERAVLTDFGLARTADDVSITRMGVIAGTPEYMSPEQAKGESIDARSDLFSLGCVLYEMATGVSPFRTETPMATLRRIVDEAPRAIASQNPELPRWFVLIVERLLEKEPARRFESAAEVSELLAGCLAHVQQPATVVLPETARLLDRDDRSSKSIQTSFSSQCGWFAGGVIALILLIGGGSFFGLLGISEKDAKPKSEKNLARISAALESYRQAHDDRFPPSAIAGRDGKGGPLHSWRVAILPYLGYQKLHDAYRFDEPWDSTHNKSLLSQMPDVFRSPFEDSTNASYFGVTLAGHQQPGAIRLGEPAPAGGASPNSEPPPPEPSEFVRSVLKEKPSDVTLNINFFDAPKVIRQADRQWLQDLIEVAEKSVKVARDQGKPWVTAELIFYQAMARVAEMDGRTDEQLKQLQIVRVLFDLLAQQTKNGEYVFLTKEATELLLRPRQAENHTRIATLKNDLREQTLCLEDWAAVQGELVKKARDAHVDPVTAEREWEQIRRWLGAARAANEQLSEGQTDFSSSQGTLYGSIADGTANTIAIVEAKRDIPWTKPEDIVFDPHSEAMQLGGWYRSGWFAAFADASVRWFPNDTDHADVRNLLTIIDRAGGKATDDVATVSRPWPPPGDGSYALGQSFVGNAIEVTGTTQGHVWGTDVYTADSNLNAAAVHAGVVAVGETRKIYVEVVEAPKSYEGSTRNGVTSSAYGTYVTAIKLHKTRPPIETLTRYTLQFDRSPSMPGRVDNAAGQTRVVGRIGELTVLQITGAKDGTVWGTHTYTADSDLATAIVHAGLASVGEKRMIAVEVVPAPESFEGTTRNGIASLSYDNYPTAIRLYDITLKPTDLADRAPNADLADRPRNVDAPEPLSNEDRERLVARLEDKPGVVSVVEITGSDRGNVWGTDIYTGDSSLAAAAVHAGLLKVGETGWICREVVPTQKSYTGTTRNGVTSFSYDEYPVAVTLRRVEGPAPAHRLQPYVGFAGTGVPAPAGKDVGPDASPISPSAAPQSGSTRRSDLGPVQIDKVIGTNLILKVTGDKLGRVCGSNPYTSDSDLPSAAVHAGLLRPAEQAWIRCETVAVPEVFEGSTRNGIASFEFREWPVAIKLSRVSERPDEAAEVPLEVLEQMIVPEPHSFADMLGTRVALQVTGGNRGPVWGNETYTTDSDFSTAAVHAGLLRDGETDWLLLETVPPPANFDGSTRNGITSQSHNNFPVAMKLSRIDADTASRTRTRILLNVTGSESNGVWGTDLYTADSAIATAAVHTGLLKVGESGWIICEDVPAPENFEGSTRNGITSQWSRYPVAYRLRLVSTPVISEPSIPEPTTLPLPATSRPAPREQRK